MTGSTRTTSRKPPAVGFNIHAPVYIYSVSRDPRMGWVVVEWRQDLFSPKLIRGREYSAMDEGQAHSIAQALHRYATTARPPEPMVHDYVVTYATLRCASAILAGAR